MTEKTLELTVDNTSLQVTIERATVLVGMRRARLKVEAEKEKDIDRKLLRTYTYADIASCTKGVLRVDGKEIAWPPDFETFLSLPDELGNQLEEAVYAINGHWLPEEKGPEAEKKALTTSTPG